MPILRKSRILCITLIVALVATVCTLLCSFTASAAGYTEGDYTYTISRGNATVTGYTGTDEAITIPETLGRYPVTTIGRSAFANSKVKEVSMPSVTIIDYYAFSNSSVQKVDMPNVLTIGGNAFSSCYSLERVYAPLVEEIYDDAFYSASDTLTIVAPFDSFAQEYAAENGLRFKPEDLRTQGDFEYTVVDDEAILIAYNGEAEYIQVPEELGGYTVTAIGSRAFYNMECHVHFTSKHIKTIYAYAFYGCTGFSFDYEESIEVIGDYAFANTKVADLQLHSATTIGKGAFSNCKSLARVEMPLVTEIGDYAFEKCSALKVVYLPMIESIGMGYKVFDSTIRSNVFYAPDGSYIYNRYNPIFPTDIYRDGIAYSVSNGEATVRCVNTSLTYGDIPEYIDSIPVTTLGTGVFSEGYEGSINTGAIKYIKSRAFSNTHVSEIYMPCVEKIDYGAFEACWSLTGIYVDDDNEYYSSIDGVLYNKDQTEIICFPGGKTDTSFTTPDSVTKVGKNAFAYQGLTSVSLPNVEIIDEYGFCVASNMTSLDAPKVTHIANRAFDGIVGLVNASFPSVITMGDYNFNSCSALTSVDMPNVTTIGEHCFSYDSALTSVTAPNVTSIGDYCFYYCASGFTFYGYNDTYLQQYAAENGLSFAELATNPVSHEIVGGKIVFTVVTPAGDYNRLKLTTTDNLRGSLVTANSYTIASDGKYVWTISFTAPTETTQYAFDLRSAETGKYMKEYITYEVEVIPTFKSVSHKIVDGKIVFTVVTSAGDYNRLKLTTADNLKGSLATASSYTVDENGNYVWKIKIAVPEETTRYAFDLRSAQTGKYIKDYGYYEAEIIPMFSAISHEIVGGKIVFTVVTSAGDYNRLKLTTADNLTGSLVTANSYTINADGKYVWTISFTAPTQTTQYAFDLRSAETGKYIKDYGYYECVVEKAIKSVDCEETENSLIFTVTTGAGDYNRLRCGTSATVVDNITNSNTYSVNVDGDYVWVITIAKPDEDIDLYFDLRSSETNKFIKDYYIYSYIA